jgi:hypothetical protein
VSPARDIWVLIKAAATQKSSVCTGNMEFRMMRRCEDLLIDQIPDLFWEFGKKCRLLLITG